LLQIQHEHVTRFGRTSICNRVLFMTLKKLCLIV